MGHYVRDITLFNQIFHMLISLARMHALKDTYFSQNYLLKLLPYLLDIQKVLLTLS
jgi:hypothetical protein